MSYSKLNILTELSANDVKFISVDKQKLDLSKYIYLWYCKFYICRDTARFYEHKKWPSYRHIWYAYVPTIPSILNLILTNLFYYLFEYDNGTDEMTV